MPGYKKSWKLYFAKQLEQVLKYVYLGQMIKLNKENQKHKLLEE